MSDKYPSLSPYAYCAWNPVKLIDHDGRDIVLSESAQKIHDKYYGKKGHEKYTELYNRLKDDKSILVTVKDCNDNERSIKERGAIGSIFELDLDDESDNYFNGRFEIEWGDPKDSYGGTKEHVYMEEICHMGQAKDKNYDIYSTTIDDEYSAKMFAIKSSSDWISNTFEDFFSNIIPTELSIIRDENPTVAKEYLLKGINRDVIRKDGSKINQKVGGHYGYLQGN